MVHLPGRQQAGEAAAAMSPGYEGQVFARWEDAWELGSSRAFFPSRKKGLFPGKPLQPVGASSCLLENYGS